MQFIGYHVDDYRDQGAPVSTGATKQEALALATTRILSNRILSGGIEIHERDDVDRETFVALTAKLNEFFGASQ